jgi:hemolysin III
MVWLLSYMTHPVTRFLDHDAALIVMADKLAEPKPRLRGLLHAGAIPFVVGAGIVLIALSPTTATKVGSAVFIGSALLLFGVSGIYHRGTWQPAIWVLLRRLDHSSIFILIAGTYTAFAMLLLHGNARLYLLSGIWGGALLGVLFRVFWTDAPRWLYTPIYIGLGWSAVFFIPDFIDGASRLGTATAVTTMTLVVAGGVLYTLGGVIYALKKPNPKPESFGFHEVFHMLTILAFIGHYAAISLATYSLR